MKRRGDQTPLPPPSFPGLILSQGGSPIFLLVKIKDKCMIMASFILSEEARSFWKQKKINFLDLLGVNVLADCFFLLKKVEKDTVRDTWKRKYRVKKLAWR